jgi:hypothetical protein
MEGLEEMRDARVLTRPSACLRTPFVFDLAGYNQECLRILRSRQSARGGWAFFADSTQDATEPTCLALLALSSRSVSALLAATDFLLRLQNRDGSWPAFVGDEPQGNGITGLVAYALMRSGYRGVAIERAIEWLLEQKGYEAHWLWKWKFKTADRHVRIDVDKFGWPWTPGTVSWVVPTAFSLFALKTPDRVRQRDVPARVRVGVEMLYDRMCVGGGWNAGNGVVYGQPMMPHPDVTAVALLALQDEKPDDRLRRSVSWLEKRARTCAAPWTIAWTWLALEAFERPTAHLTSRLLSTIEPAAIKDSATLAIVCLATQPNIRFDREGV